MSEKLTNLKHLRMAAQGSKELSAQVASAALEAIEALDQAKQDTLTGAEGQVVGFNAAGEAVAQDASSGGLTQEEADSRYLGLDIGGRVLKSVTIGAKNYVASLVLDGPYNGDLIMDGDPPVASSKKVVIEATTRYEIKNGRYVYYPILLLSGRPVYIDQSLNMKAHKIEDVAAPVLDNDAATKKYVDNAINALRAELTGG